MSSVAEMIPILLWWQGEMIKQMESSSTHLITEDWQNNSEEEFISIIERNIELLKSTPANYQKIATCVKLSTYFMMLASTLRDK